MDERQRLFRLREWARRLLIRIEEDGRGWAVNRISGHGFCVPACAAEGLDDVEEFLRSCARESQRK